MLRTQPLILVLSRRPAFQGQLPIAIAERATVIVGDELKDAVRLCMMHRATKIVLDFTDASRSGEAECRLLDQLAERSSAPLFVILPRTVAAALADRCQVDGIEIFPAGITAVDLAAAILRELPGLDSEEGDEGVETAVNDPPPSRMKKTASVPANRLKAAAKGTAAPAKAESRESAVSSPASDPGAATLQGISRRFETRSKPLANMLCDLEVAARHDVTMLLIGETGAGKTFLSRLIHEVSPRCDEPFITVACGALPNDLIESELFGHVKGSFTGAHADKEGKFVAAGRGTILLDEIDVLGLEQQVKLLRVIETGEFEPVGSNQTIRSQARLVVASNLNLQPLVQEGKFRPDLYYRLNMLKFDVPPLRQRREDVEMLARRFVNQLSKKHSVRIDRIDTGFIESLLIYPWPGNVRELENVIQRAVIYCRDGVLTAQHLPSYILSGQVGPTNDPSVRLNSAEPAANTLGDRIADSERELIEKSLYRNNFSRTNTARDLGISRVTLYNKMKKHGMMH